MARWSAWLCAAVATFALAACGSDEKSPSTTGSTTGGGSAQAAPEKPAEMTSVSVAVGQTIDSIAAFQAAQQEGLFEKHNLEVKGNVMPYGPGLLSSVVSGENQFSFAVVSDALQAADGGLPIQMVAPGATTDQRRGTVSAIVGKRGAIQDPAELEGKTVAVPVLNSLPVLQVNAVVEQAGGDPSTIEYVALDFPSMLPALKSGKIDAAFLVEPFITISGAEAEQSPFEVVFGNPDKVIFPSRSTVSAWFTTNQYASENPEITTAFGQAIAEAQQYLIDNPEDMRRITATALKLPPELAKAINIGVPGAGVNVDSVALVAQKMAEGGLIKEAPPMEEFIYEGAPTETADSAPSEDAAAG